jgi:hypothetical protein
MAKKVIVTGVTETTVQEAVPNDEFETVLYTSVATGVAQDVPLSNIDNADFLWIKPRSEPWRHRIFNSIVGDGALLVSNTTDAELVNSSYVSTTTGKFTVTNSNINTINDDYVAWCASLPNHNPSNTDGTITSETKSNSFMSVVSWTNSSSTTSDTVGSGLTDPDLVIIKSRTNGTQWNTYLDGHRLALDQTSASQPDTQLSFPLGNIIPLNAVSHDRADGNMIAYCFTSVAGKCKVGSYNGTGSAGNAVDCGFEPAWVMIKRTDSAGSWAILDNARGATTGNDSILFADLSNVEYVGFDYIDFTSTGFTNNGASNDSNASGGTYIYIAIAKDVTNETQQYDLTFAEQASAPTGVSLPSKEVLVSTTETYNPTDNDFDVVGTATKSGRAMKINLVAEEADTTITTNPVVNLNKEP